MNSRLHLHALLTSLALATSATHAQEQTALLVKDANRNPVAFPADVRWVMPAGNGSVFAQDTLARGSELWFSDGTAKGTVLLKDILPGPGGSDPRNPVAFAGNKVAFRCDYRDLRNELWITDGTAAGTLRIHESAQPAGSSETDAIAGTDGGIFFIEENESLADPPELFFSDGTAAGTRSLNPFEGETRARFSAPTAFVTSGPWCYFIANENEIWRSDGTEAGTTSIATFTGFPRYLKIAGSHLFIEGSRSHSTRELWSCPLTGGELTKLGSRGEYNWISISDLSVLGNDVFFVAYEAGSDPLFWASDGTPAGTRQIPLSLTTPGDDSYREISSDRIIAWRGELYFTAYNYNGNHYELWRTDGTAAGTRHVQTFPVSSGEPWAFESWVSADSALYFFMELGSGRFQLWQTQGDAATTRLVKGTPIVDADQPAGPMLAPTAKGVFLASGQTTPDSSLSLLKPKGGATRLTKPEKANASGTPRYPENALPYLEYQGNLLHFVNTGRGHEMWQVDPKGRSKALWKLPVTLDEDQGRIAFRGTAVKGPVFSFDDSVSTGQVWGTDGTKKGTGAITVHRSGYAVDSVSHDGLCFFSAKDADASKNCTFMTRGPGGAVQVTATNATFPFPDPGELVVFENTIVLISTGADGKSTLWRSSGESTVYLVKKNFYGAEGGRASNLSVVNGKLNFTVTLSDREYLWESPGYEYGTGTVQVTPAIAFEPGSMSRAFGVGGAALFQARIPGEPLQWWRHSGTETKHVRQSIEPGQYVDHLAGPYSKRQAVAGTQLFYRDVKVDEFGFSHYELCVTDGTSEGSHLVKDIFPGTLGSSPDQFLAVGNLLYFTATDPDHGNELWRSDGTDAGTILVADIEPGPRDSSPAGLMVVGAKLYFNAHRRDIGRELYSIDLPK